MSGRAPILRKNIQGKKSYCWRLCPYSTADNFSNRIPSLEKTAHTVTSGQMSLDVRGGHDNVGFVCLDPGCPFFLGTAVTPVIMQVTTVSGINYQSGEYTMQTQAVPIPICSGTHFWEK